ncbi:DUF523 domain-containing protein [Malaciobacter mytili]|uniref:DUF523 domain-containing protein n=1 Tax=Malaciobacter mytili LMG 24559 TaxID=1032238 RepID=A0AAX2AF06_9BACT|nr:DUF523 domain-containing protein [Malaciobacter mytili]AXH15083.1 DUF523 domain-containing protein [Malaciobacter mytili LMG 24559]RXK15592.1 hypothetical protein CP985_07485 [Malaciobacter mytili LMG 24559]
MKILVSSCLLGENVRYDSKSSIYSIEDLQLFNKIILENKVFSICPEISGGLLTPREPAEIIKNQVLTKTNENVTKEFIKGSIDSLNLCKKENIKVALLKAKSPSCGNNKIYDGTFSGILVDGMGITAKLLIENNIKVFNEKQLKDLYDFIKNYS